MPANRPTLAVVALILLCSLSTAVSQDLHLQPADGYVWRKGNMHTHSLWSDGDNYPEMIATWYRDRGYDFLVFTDHNTLLQQEKWVTIDEVKGGRHSFEALKNAFPAEWLVTRTTDDKEQIRLKTFDEIFAFLAVPQKFLLIQGEEITDKFRKHPVHLCATNTLEFIPPAGGDSVADVIQRNIDAARSLRERTGVRTLVHVNHPNFGYAITAEQMMQVEGENFFEVYNGHPTVHNSGDATHAGTERMWDIINSFRLAKLDLPVMYGLATDDGHNYFEDSPAKGAQPGRGWVQVLAKSLDPGSLVESLEAGNFYSSSGVVLNEIHFAAGLLKVTIAAEPGLSYRTDFIGTRKGFHQDSTPADEDAVKADGLTRVYSSEIGAVLKSVEGASAEYDTDGTELYVRAVITSSRLHPNPSEAGEFERAWVQPVVLHAAH